MPDQWSTGLESKQLSKSQCCCFNSVGLQSYCKASQLLLIINLIYFCFSFLLKTVPLQTTVFLAWAQISVCVCVCLHCFAFFSVSLSRSTHNYRWESRLQVSFPTALSPACCCSLRVVWVQKTHFIVGERKRKKRRNGSFLVKKSWVECQLSELLLLLPCPSSIFHTHTHLQKPHMFVDSVDSLFSLFSSFHICTFHLCCFVQNSTSFFFQQP